MLPPKRILRSSKYGIEIKNMVGIRKRKRYNPKNPKSKSSNAIKLEKFDATKVKIKNDPDSEDFRGKGKKDVKKEDPDLDLEDFDEFEVTISRNKRNLSQQTNRQPCPECGKMLAKSSVKEHLEIHANNRYRCYRCGEGFSSRLAVRDHNMRYHTLKNKSLNSCKCNYCSKPFKGSSKLAEHLCKAHGKAEKQTDKSKNKSTVSKPTKGRPKADRSFKCAICEKTFIKFDQLRNHIAIHQHGCGRCGFEMLARESYYWHRCII